MLLIYFINIVDRPGEMERRQLDDSMSDYRGELTGTVVVGSLIAFGRAKPAVFPTCVRSTSDRRWAWTIYPCLG
jgi:hypothetical protein